jgi:putative membrane protein
MDKNLKTALIIVGIVVAILVVLPLAFGATSGRQYGGWGMMGPGMMGGFGWMWLIPVFWILILGLIIWAVIAAVRRPGESDSSARSADSALELLKKRYARGEIDKQEYEEKKKDLL